MDKARTRVFMTVIIGGCRGWVYVQNGGNCTNVDWAGCTPNILDADGSTAPHVLARVDADFSCFPLSGAAFVVGEGNKKPKSRLRLWQHFNGLTGLCRLH